MEQAAKWHKLADEDRDKARASLKEDFRLVMPTLLRNVSDIARRKTISTETKRAIQLKLLSHDWAAQLDGVQQYENARAGKPMAVAGNKRERLETEGLGVRALQRVMQIPSNECTTETKLADVGMEIRTSWPDPTDNQRQLGLSVLKAVRTVNQIALDMILQHDRRALYFVDRFGRNALHALLSTTRTELRSEYDELQKTLSALRDQEVALSRLLASQNPAAGRVSTLSMERRNTNQSILELEALIKRQHARCQDILIYLRQLSDLGTPPLLYPYHLNMMSFLLSAGVNVNQKDRSGRNLLHRLFLSHITKRDVVAVVVYEVAAKLLAYGIDVNHKDKHGVTPLMALVSPAISVGPLPHPVPRVDVVQLLLTHKADVNLTDAKGRDCMHYIFQSIRKGFIDGQIMFRCLPRWQGIVVPADIVWDTPDMCRTLELLKGGHAGDITQLEGKEGLGIGHDLMVEWSKGRRDPTTIEFLKWIVACGCDIDVDGRWSELKKHKDAFNAYRSGMKTRERSISGYRALRNLLLTYWDRGICFDRNVVGVIASYYIFPLPGNLEPRKSYRDPNAPVGYFIE